MCGIVGYIGNRPAQDIILGGLHQLEYRGYDSSGISVIEAGALRTVKRVGKLAALDAALAEDGLQGTVGIGHTRWATHGAPSSANAHPHCDGGGEFSVVHNGIIENFQELREGLVADGVTLCSETDTEVLPHLIQKHYAGDLLHAVQEALKGVRGAFAIGVVSSREPEVLVAARKGSPLIIGLGEGEHFIASDVPAIIRHTRRVIYLEEGQCCALRGDGVVVEDLAGNAQSPEVVTVDLDVTVAEKEDYPHFMLKEIHQQPDVMRHLLVSYLDSGTGSVRFPDLGLSDDDLRGFRRIVVVACGTAWHAGLVGKYLLEEFARISVEVDFASEFRYGNRVLDEETLVIPVTQSGETADTLEAVRIARRANSTVLAVVNVPGSTIARESAGVIYTQAGPEIGVASTKAYTSQITVLALFAFHLARLRGVASMSKIDEVLDSLRDIPTMMERCLEDASAVELCAKLPRYRDAGNAMFIGRGYNYPSALEGALKLKEISYIHVEGYAAGEMKHGPIALVTNVLPVVSVAVQGAVYEKVISNIQEVRARGGIVLCIATAGDDAVKALCDDVLFVPACHEALTPLLVAIPLQLFAYHVANALGKDVDQPRNLAKSVTVE
jgi:glucosamine--fructose-6-phosphate aminotransferase (isomerizing)